MSGEFQGSATRIREKYAQATYVRATHKIWPLETFSVLVTMNEIIRFSRNSTRRLSDSNTSVSELEYD